MNILLALLDYTYILKVLVRCSIAVIISGLIGSERAKHGRAAGMRTHILVCLGSCLTSLTGSYMIDTLGTGDPYRISAQVISGIGFLGAGMIILKSNNVITGLTTAAGVWTTSVIGIAIGFGFYSGAIIVTLLFLITIVLFAKFERKRKSMDIIYIEIDDMYQTNRIINDIAKILGTEFTRHINPPKSMHQGHLGIIITCDKQPDFIITDLLEIDGVVFVEEEH